MIVVASGRVRDPAAPMLEASFAGAASRRSLVAAIKHGLAIGAAAAVLQVLLLLALLYACGIIAF